MCGPHPIPEGLNSTKKPRKARLALRLLSRGAGLCPPLVPGSSDVEGPHLFSWVYSLQTQKLQDFSDP